MLIPGKGRHHEPKAVFMAGAPFSAAPHAPGVGVVAPGEYGGVYPGVVYTGWCIRVLSGVGLGERCLSGVGARLYRGTRAGWDKKHRSDTALTLTLFYVPANVSLTPDCVIYFIILVPEPLGGASSSKT